jgi:hypothetical protein
MLALMSTPSSSPKPPEALLSTAPGAASYLRMAMELKLLDVALVLLPANGEPQMTCLYL